MEYPPGGTSTPLPNARIVVRDIQRSFDESGIEEQDVTAQSAREWNGGEGIKRRAKRLEWDDIYTRMFALTSDAVHGSWEDLRVFHLKSHGGGVFTVREAPPRWTYEILVGMCEFVAKAIEVLVRLVPDDYPERSELTDEINTTFARMAALYHTDQANIAKQIANAYEAAGWQSAGVDESMLEECPPLATLGIQGGVQIIVNRPDCYVTIKVIGRRIEHHTLIPDLLIEIGNVWLGLETLSFGGHRIKPDNTTFIMGCIDVERQRLSARFGSDLSIETSAVIEIETGPCLLSAIRMSDCESINGQTVKKRLYLTRLLNNAAILLYLCLTSEYQTGEGQQILLEAARTIEESPIPINVEALRRRPEL